MSKFYMSLFIFSFVGVQFHAQIVNKGDLKIESGTSVYLGENFTNEATGSLDTEGNIHVNGDFTNDGFVSSTNGTAYFNSSSNATQNLSGASQTVQFYNLEVNNTAVGVNGLEVADGFNLKVTNGVGIYGGKLRLMGGKPIVAITQRNEFKYRYGSFTHRPTRGKECLSLQLLVFAGSS